MITVVLEHCDEKGMDHGDEKGMEPCHDRVQGAYWRIVSGRIVMTSVLSIVMTKVMEHCDEKTMDNGDDEHQGVLWW